VDHPRLRAEEDIRRAVALSEAAWKAAEEEHALEVAAQSNAREAVISRVRSLLSRGLPSEDGYDPVFKKLAEICESGGLELSGVLQEPLIDEKPPVYWAILNGPPTSSEDGDGDAAFDALVVALVGASQPLKESTITSIRHACMLTSNNTLLQHLFRRFPDLAPLNPGDVILLSSTGGGDVVEIEESLDGTGIFVAHIQIRRFRLRMRVSKLVKIEFVTSGTHTYAFRLCSV